MTELLAITAVGLLAYAAISKRTANSILTAPMFFVGLGILIRVTLTGQVDLHEHDVWLHGLAEITLALVLFTDASRIDLKLLRRDHDLPNRMLGIGLPLTILAGIGAAALVLPGLGLLEAALVAAILAPTDAALGQAVVSDPSVPVRVRQALNVESGLNDGIALPAVLIFLYATTATHQASVTTGYWIQFTVMQVTLGPLVGATVGWLGGLLVDRATAAGWMSDSFRELSVLGLAILAFAAAETVGGNGFLATFVAGLTLGNTARRACASMIEFGESAGQLLTLLTFTAFGALLVPLAFERFDGAVLLYAVLSLTVVRAIPVALSLAGKKLNLATIGFLAWFGPRGIASIVFALLVVEQSGMKLAHDVAAVVAMTVLLSVFAHGMTAAPLARWFARRIADAGLPADSAEARVVAEMPLRHSRSTRARPDDS